MILSVEGILNLFYTKDMRLYSIIIPVYNRPDELDDLLSSLCKQTYVHFEVIVVEDGSEIPAKEIVGRYQGRLIMALGKRLASICSYWILTWYYPPRGLSIYTTR